MPALPPCLPVCYAAEVARLLYRLATYGATAGPLFVGLLFIIGHRLRPSHWLAIALLLQFGTSLTNDN
jgi:hypothetical protein